MKCASYVIVAAIATARNTEVFAFSSDATRTAPFRRGHSKLAASRDPTCTDEGFTRRDALTKSVSAFLAITSTAASPFAAEAKPYPQEEADKQKIVKGYKRLQYLLDNWEKETTVCGRSDNPYIGDGKGCERTPEKVMDYLGYKSTEDPLFKVEKTLTRLQVLTDEPDFLDAMDKFLEQADESNIMAFVSSWGEANPGGGKDRVEKFIERSKTNVIQSRDALATVIRVLDLKVD